MLVVNWQFYYSTLLGEKSARAYNTHPHLKTTVEPVIVATCIERPPLQKSQLQIPNTNTLIHLSKATY